jgi:large subunit ribosomal protein L17
MLKNLASSLILTERETDADLDDNAPKVKGRVVTTLHKAKEVRPLVEKCITIARKSLKAQEDAEQYATQAERNTDAWRAWRDSEDWRKWNQAISPAVAARRRVVELIGSKEAMHVLFDEIAPRFEDRDGGYTRILHLAKTRVGDSGKQAILEFVGVHDREKVVSEKPAFEASDDVDETTDEVAEVSEDQPESSSEQPEASSDAEPAGDDAADAKKDDSPSD